MTHNQAHNRQSWALVTGASGGIGLAYCEELAKQQQAIILVARNENKLKEVSDQLRIQYDVPTKVIAADLSTPEGIEKVIQHTQGLNISTLINNAGKEESGNFLNLAPQDMLSSIALNCSAPLLLTHHFANEMAKQGTGNILFISSIVAFQGVPLIANYAGTKSYLLTFAEGLARELAPKGVKVSIAAPGFTNTNLAAEMDFSSTPIKPLDATYVARYTLERLGKKRIIIPGFINKVLYFLGKYLQPRAMNSLAFGRVFKMVLGKKLALEKAAR